MTLYAQLEQSFNKVGKENLLALLGTKETAFGDSFVQIVASKDSKKCDIYIKDVLGTSKYVTVNYNQGGIQSANEALFLYSIITGTQYKK